MNVTHHVNKSYRRFQQGGMVEQGNIDLIHRPVHKNPDGSISTVKTIGMNIDGYETNLPTIADDGHEMTPQEAVREYRRTGKHLGKYRSVDDAERAAQQLHIDQMRLYAPREKE